MQYRNLGKSPLRVSTLCLGTMMFGDQTPPEVAARIVAHAHEQGVNFIDTADVYAKGESEAIVGQLTRAQRSDWIIATKVGNAMSETENQSGLSRHWIISECEASLARLQTGHIDIYYLHRDFNDSDLEEPLRALQTLLDSGKIRYWGVSNFRGWRIAELVRLAQSVGMPAPVVCQPYYNLLNRQPEVEILPACRHYGLGVVPYSPMARGVLSGKYKPGAEPIAETRAGRGDKRIMQTEFRAESLVIAEMLLAHCQEKGISPGHFACAWVLANRTVTSIIAGPRTFEQWLDYAAALDYPLTDDDENLVNKLVAPGHPSTPGYNDPLYPLNGRPVGMSPP